MGNLNDLGKDVKTRRGSYLDWRKDGKIILWVHPRATYGKRIKLMLPVPKTNEDGDKIIGWVSRYHQGVRDIANQVLIWLKEDVKHLDDDENVLEIKHGRKSDSWKRGELIKAPGYEKLFKKRLLNPRTEYVLCVVDNGDIGKGLQLLTLSKQPAENLWAALVSECEENGYDSETDDIADYLAKDPFPVKLTYNEHEKNPQNRYKASVPRKMDPTDEILELLESEPLDCEAECDPDLEDASEHGTTTEILSRLCVIDCPMLESDVEEEKPKEKKRRKRTQKASTKTDDDDRDEMPENFGSSKKSNGEPPKKPGKPTKKKGGKTKVKASNGKSKEEPAEVEVRDCIVDNFYVDEDGDRLQYLGLNEKGNRGRFLAEDNEEYLIGLSDIVLPDGKKKRGGKTKASSSNKCRDCGHTLDGSEEACPGCGISLVDAAGVF